ncbi:hypothetical protein KLL36_17315 [Clostridioides difficile]|uniref:DUF6619 domain-containing protein n=1 Tax=Clostridioides difficile TaxID=1496 RepID=UPI000D1EF32E|nr:DUF6619 domain-containing protein [Clostridioides difficile]MDL5065740.1 hypothetical protein [Clostridioides difficile]MDN9455134.1 hypothetical protein [Clostridioides difficile]HBF7900019.1 hypothetical protein [Clostridioides difficile]
MNKHGIRLISFILSLFSFIMVFQNIMNDQQQLPLGTTEQFVLNIADTRTTKEKLISELDNITNKHNATLVKVVIPSDEYKNKKDIIYFGDEKPKSSDIIIDNNNIKWLDSSLEGKLISSKDIGNRPLYGNYAVKGNQDFKQDIETWANDNGITIQWSSKVLFIKSLYYNLVHNGVGNVILTALLLFISALLTWFISHSRARSIRLLGGVTAGKIHIEDMLTLSKPFIFNYVISLVVFWLYIGITNDFKQISLMLFKDIITLLVLILISALISIGISAIVKPKMEHLAKREIPFKKFRILSIGTRIMSIILALLIIPSTITSAYIAQKLSKEYSLWENMQSNVSLSFGDLDSLSTEKMLPYVDEFFSNMEVKNNLSLSLVIDKSIQLNEEEYGGYDHIIITDKSWIDSFDIGIRENKNGGKLNKVELDTLDKPLQDFLNTQMPIWTKTEEVQPDGINFYEFSGDKFLALSSDGSTIQTKNPLVILVDNPVESLNTLGFTLPACSSGNIVFPNENLLRNEIAKSPIKEYVTSIDTIADVALTQAQKFAKEAVFYIIACILILVSMVFAGILTAQLWVSENKKRIFTLHTFGKSYKEIIMRTFVNESYIAIITIVIGAIISFVIKRTEGLTILLVSMVILILYCLSNFIAYHICTRQAFYKVATRNE